MVSGCEEYIYISFLLDFFSEFLITKPYPKNITNEHLVVWSYHMLGICFMYVWHGGGRINDNHNILTISVGALLIASAYHACMHVCIKYCMYMLRVAPMQFLVPTQTDIHIFSLYIAYTTSLIALHLYQNTYTYTHTTEPSSN